MLQCDTGLTGQPVDCDALQQSTIAGPLTNTGYSSKVQRTWGKSAVGHYGVRRPGAEPAAGHTRFSKRFGALRRFDDCSPGMDSKTVRGGKWRLRLH